MINLKLDDPEAAERHELDLATVKRRTVRGVVTLIIRNQLSTLITVAGFALLSAKFRENEIGTYILVSAVIDIFTYFSDVGLAAALVQKKTTPTLQEFRISFTL